MSNTENPFFGTLIHSYSRAQAIADGVLVDVSSTAREAGIKFPCAVTRAVFDAYVKIPPGVRGQDQSGRLFDVVNMLRLAIRQAPLRAQSGGGDTIRYKLYVRNSNRERLDRRDRVELKAICGPGDDAEPVITIMLPTED